MGLENFEEYKRRSMITFPRVLRDNGPVELLAHIRNQGSYEIGYHVENEGRMGFGWDQKPLDGEYTSKIGGSMRKIGNPISVTFEFYRKGSISPRGFDGLRFSSIGKDYNEVPDSEIEIWDDVRKHVRTYFKKS